MTSPKHALDVTTPNDLDIVMTRAFAAPRSLVFDAFTKPEHVRVWLLGPDGWTMPECTIDLRPGGRFHYRWQSESGEKSFGLAGTYLEIDAPARIVHRENFDESWYPENVTVTTTFEERNGATTVTMTLHFANKAARDESIESGMTGGVATSFDRLESTVLAAI